MARRFPPEFKAGVVRVARRGDLGVTEVAADFDISVQSVQRWKRQADIDDWIKDGLTSAERAEIVQLWREKRRPEMKNEILQRAAAYFAFKDITPQNEVSAGPRTGRRGVLGAADLRSVGPFQPGLLQVGGVSDLSARLDDAHLTSAIVDIHADDPEFGYRFISDELERDGHQVSEGRVHRLCREHRIWSTTTKKGRRAGRP